MHDIPNRIADVLLEVEAVLRTSGKWDAFRPPEGVLLSSRQYFLYPVKPVRAGFASGEQL